MFWQKFLKLCKETGKSPNRVATDLSLNSGTVTNWKNGGVPFNATMLKIANYFSVPVSYFTEEEPEPQGETLSEQEKALVRLFRETTEEGKLEMIAAMVNIRNQFQEKKKPATAG